jgi:nucleotide-binding universal stress UspA family protein
MEGTWFLAATWLAAEQLVLAAERHHADLIVMGRRGKSTFKRWMLGSISERVLGYAHCPVLVIH